MKKIIKEYQVYNYEELSEKSKEKALYNHMIDSDAFYDLYNSFYKNDILNMTILEHYKIFIDELNIEGYDIDYGGFLLLKGSINIEKYVNHYNIEKLKPLLNILDNETATIKNNNSKTNYIDLYGIDCLSSNYYYELANEKGLDASKYEELIDELQNSLEKELKDIENIIIKIFKKEYEYLQSEQYFKELCNANDYTFLEDGTMFNE